jgi:NADH-quinone oxidoreductase subunit E
MTKQKTKSTFIGLKVTDEQAETIAQLQQQLRSSTKTEVILRALELLATSSQAFPQLSSQGLPRSLPRVATSLELSRLETETRQYLGVLRETQDRSEEVMKQMVKELARVDQTVDKYNCDRSYLIQMLLDIQRENRWLPKEALLWLSQKLDIPLSHIYHVATFYKAFSLVPQGRHSVAVCLGTACHVRGAPKLLEKVTEALKINPGETSGDMRFSLATVNCLGCCALGPVMTVDGEYHSNPATQEMEEFFASCD